MITGMQTICAWCQPGSGTEGQSHGICKKHAHQVRANHRAKRLTRWNHEQWRTETLCCGHWWIGPCCLYGNHDLR